MLSDSIGVGVELAIAPVAQLAEVLHHGGGDVFFGSAFLELVERAGDLVEFGVKLENVLSAGRFRYYAATSGLG